MINITTFIYQQLSGTPSIATQAKQIKPVVAEEGKWDPALIYTRIAEHRKGIVRIGIYQISAWSEQLWKAEALIDEVIKHFSGLKIPPIRHCSLMSLDQSYYSEKRMHGAHATLRFKLVDENF